MSTRDKLLRLDKQLQKLEERLEPFITKQARSFYKAAQRIFKDGFCPKLALKILAQVHETAVAIQKQEEEAISGNSPRKAPASRGTNPV
ncbi:MAG TPA: hypothetical protein VMW10_01595 [Alphaproteobacteria bacterium]|nr:hypothetical protein [Alphaproteobacteria bacterium]